jgi:prepilin-type N-terminal cleavage/methylation domain-containing protein
MKTAWAGRASAGRRGVAPADGPGSRRDSGRIPDVTRKLAVRRRRATVGPCGVTLIELAIVLAIAGLLAAVGVPRVSRWMDRLAVDRAGSEIAVFYARARLAAVFRSTRVRLEFSQDSLIAAYEGPADSAFLRWSGPARHGVSLEVTRPVIRIHPTGVGWGAANTKLVLTRGAAAESLTTSRLGRLKRWR